MKVKINLIIIKITQNYMVNYAKNIRKRIKSNR